MEVLNLEQIHPEVKAYIYQQMAEIEQLLPEGSNVTIQISDHSDEDDIRLSNNVASKIRIRTPYGEINALEKATDIYNSLFLCKQSLISQLGAMQRHVAEEQSERSHVVESVIKKERLH